jgi:predicted transcriptional regulator of viral defense system
MVLAMTTKAPTSKKLRASGLGAVVRPRDLEQLGISLPVLQRMVASGVAAKVGPGVCLLSALAIHGIGTQSPHQVWIAIDNNARAPTRLGKLVRVVRFSGRLLTYGVEQHDILGVPVRITSPARTVVDCFRFRNKIGIDVAIEALRDAVQTRKVTVSDVARVAEVCRARTVLRPYLEAISS